MSPPSSPVPACTSPHAGTANSPRIGSLCTGFGGLDEAARQVFGGSLAWVSEYEPPTETNPRPSQAGARLLAYRYPEVPNHGDLTAMDWTAAEPVDVLTAGWPCQPFSSAGRQLGWEDPRAIWPAIARAVRVLRPRLVVLENVARVVAVGELERAVTDLARVGYVGSWTCLRASDIGAPHRRERLFVVAADTSGERTAAAQLPRRPRRTVGSGVTADAEGVGRPPVRLGRRDEPERSLAGRARSAAPDPTGDRRGEGRPESAGVVRGPHAAVGGATAADAHGARQQQPEGLLAHVAGRPDDGPAQDFGQYAAAIHRWAAALGRPAPAPTVAGHRGGRRLNPRFVEWLMGLDEGWVCDVPGLSRNDQLRLLGNGVVPQQGAAAIAWLADRLPAWRQAC